MGLVVKHIRAFVVERTSSCLDAACQKRYTIFIKQSLQYMSGIL